MPYIFLEQNRRLDKAEAELKAAEARHVDDIAAVEAKYADVARDKAQSETLIRALKGAIEKATNELEEVKCHKEFLKSELVNVRRGKSSTISIEQIVNDAYIRLATVHSSTTTTASVPQGTSSTSTVGSHSALSQPPSKRQLNSTPTPRAGSSNNSASAPSTASTVIPSGSAQASNAPTWSPSPIIPLGGPGSKGIPSVLAAVPPDYAKRELKNVTRVDEIRKFRAIWKYHRDQNLQMEDWLAFIPSTLHPSITALLYGCRDHEGNSVYADEAIEAWKTWDVIELLDAIINCIEPIPIQVNAPIDALESVTMPTSFVSTTFVPEFLQRYTEQLSLRNLQYEPVASEPNPSLVRALDARIRGIGETATKLTSKIRSLNHGELPSTFAGYIRNVSEILSKHLHAQQTANALLPTQDSKQPYGGSGRNYRSNSVNSLQPHSDSKPEYPSREPPPPIKSKRCSGCGNASHTSSRDCFFVNTQWFNKEGGEFKTSVKGKEYQRAFKSDRIRWRDVEPDTLNIGTTTTPGQLVIIVWHAIPSAQRRRAIHAAENAPAVENEDGIPIGAVDESEHDVNGHHPETETARVLQTATPRGKEEIVSYLLQLYLSQPLSLLSHRSMRRCKPVVRLSG